MLQSSDWRLALLCFELRGSNWERLRPAAVEDQTAKRLEMLGKRQSILKFRIFAQRQRDAATPSVCQRVIFKKSTKRCVSGFSLVEVAAAIGIVAFALLSIVALLPIGLESNRTASEETRAVNILTVLDADLRNTFSTTGNSHIFGLPGPYKAASETAMTLSPNGPALNTLHTIGLKENETVVPAATGLRFQVSVIYTKLPPTGSLEACDARLIVSWPCLSGASITDLTDPSNVSGYVESYVSFPTP